MFLWGSLAFLPWVLFAPPLNGLIACQTFCMSFAFNHEVECSVTQNWLEKELLYFQARRSVGRELCRLRT